MQILPKTLSSRHVSDSKVDNDLRFPALAPFLVPLVWLGVACCGLGLVPLGKANDKLTSTAYELKKKRRGLKTGTKDGTRNED
jgi:hypothetical protein